MRIFVSVIAVAVLTVAVRPEAGQDAPVQVCGTVLTVTCSAIKDRTTTVAVASPRRDVIFPLAILSGDRVRFSPAPEEQYRGADICATGRIEIQDALPRMVVRAPTDITIRKLPDPVPRPWPGQHFYQCDDAVEMPVLTHDRKPRYTAEAQSARKQGTVELEALVRLDGTVGDVRVTKSLDAIDGLDREAVSAVKQWRFKPGTRAGQAVQTIVAIEVTFTLK